MANSVCRVKADETAIKNFLQSWTSRLQDDLDASRDNFLASVLSTDQLELNILLKELDNLGITINVLDLNPNIARQVHPEFTNWELRDSNSEINIFGSSELCRLIKQKFALDAYRYCIVDTTKGIVDPLVSTKEQLVKNIAKFKEHLIKELLFSAMLFNDELNSYNSSNVIIFNHTTGADQQGYNDIMKAAKSYFGEIDLKTVDTSDEDFVNSVYYAFALTNFDYLLDEIMYGIVQKSPKNLFGNLHRIEYDLVRTAESEQLDLQGISDQEYENALNFITPQIAKIISAIPKVRYNLGNKVNRFQFSEFDSTLLIPDILQLSHWLQINLSNLTEVFKLENLDLLARPIYTIKTVLKALYDNIKDYHKLPASSPIRKFIKENNTRSSIQTAISLYEYLFNEEIRIDEDTISISEINSQYQGTPKFNIITEIVQQLIQSTAPAFIEHNLQGLIYDEETGSIDKNYIQRYEHSRVRYSFLDPMVQCLYREGLKEKSDVANAILNKKGLSLAAAIQNDDYLRAIRTLLGIQTGDKETIKFLLKEADTLLNGKLGNSFIQLAEGINRIIKNGVNPDSFIYWQNINAIVSNSTKTLDYDIIGVVLGSLIDATPSSVFMSRDGNQLGIYRTTSLVFMMDHLIKRYKHLDEESQTSDPDYKPLRNRTNFFVDNPGLLRPSEDNPAYLSQVAIPLSMGTEDVSLDARRLPEFIQDLHAFTGEFLSLMTGIKNSQAAPILAFQLGTYSDKTTLPLLVINGKTRLTGKFSRQLTIADLLSKPLVLLMITQAYQSSKTLDLVNHIIEDWKEIFNRLLLNPPAYRGNSENFIDTILSESSDLRQLIDTFIKKKGISEELLATGEGSHSDLFNKYLQTPDRKTSAFIPLMNKVNSMKNIILENIDILNRILELMPSSFLLEIIPQLANENKDLSRKGLKIVGNLYTDTYKVNGKNIYQFNRMVFDDLLKDCSIQNYSELFFDSDGYLNIPDDSYENYYQRMAIQGLSKEYSIDGENLEFLEYLINYFNNNSYTIQKMIGKTGDRTIGNRVKIFDNLYSDKGELNLNALVKLYFSYLTLTNFLRHLALDLSIKEAYVDKASNKNDLVSERSTRQQTTTKRNNTLTATIIPFMMDLVDGVSTKTKICMIADTQGGVFNTIGADREVDEFDGMGLNSPIQVRMEDASLNKKHRVSTKKTFITPVNDYSAEELKWASNEITNLKIRESQGCQINLLSIFKRMHNIKFDYDITKTWQSDELGELSINSILGKSLYSREGFKYYRYDTIEKTENKDEYIISKYEVDPTTGEDVGEEIKTTVVINTIYGIYEALNGINCVERTSSGFQYSEDIMDFLYNMVWKVGEFKEDNYDISQSALIQPLRESFVGILANNSANKRGASNIVTGEAWRNDDIPLSYTEIELACGGEQLSAEHASDGSTITKGTQLILDLAQKGYTSEIVENLYKSIAKVMDYSSPDFDALMKLYQLDNVPAIQEKISNKILKQLEITGTSEELLNLIAEFKREADELGEPFILPLSILTREVIKSYAPELNKNVIKQQDSGLMGTITGSSGFIQVYNLDNKIYSMGDFLSYKNLNKYKGSEYTIIEYCNLNDISFNEIIRLLSILDLNDDLVSAENYFKSDPKAEFVLGDDYRLQKWMILMFDTLRNQNDRRVKAQTFFSVNPDSDHFLGFNKIAVSQIKPGITVINTVTYKPILVDSVADILELRESGIEYVMEDKMAPTDLLPSILTVETESGYIENEYTSSESLLGARLNRFRNNRGRFNLLLQASLIRELSIKESKELENIYRDLIPFVKIIKYINETPEYILILDNIDNGLITEQDLVILSQLQEDIQNFKNHVKAFGYTLEGFDSQNIEDYYKGFNPLENFEYQLLEGIIQEDIINKYIIPGLPIPIDIINSIQFYIDHQASDTKKEILSKVISDLNLLKTFIQEHPQFIFKILPYNKLDRYNQFLLKIGFSKIIKSDISTAQLIMPRIYRGQMKLGNIDLVDVNFNFFKDKAPTFYKIRSEYIEDNSVNVDFVVRTFNGLYNIVVSQNLTDKDLDKFGYTLSKDDIIIDEEGYRINPRNKQRLYKVPSIPYIIKKNGNSETIILKSESGVLDDIYSIIESTSALVSVLPFVSNILSLEKGKYQNLRRVLTKLKYLNNIPSFTRMYLRLDEALASDNIRLNIIQLKNELHQDYINTQEDYEEKYRNQLFVAFLRSLDVISTRIPTQNMSSIMTMKVAAFTQSDINDVFVTKWQQWLQGSDQDIDKAFILGYNFDDYGRFVTWSPLLLMYNEDIFERSLKLPLPTGELLKYGVVEGTYDVTFGGDVDSLMNTLVLDYKAILQINPELNYTSFLNIQRIAQKYNINLTGNSELDFDKLKVEILTLILNRLEKVGGLYLTTTHRGLKYFNELVEQINHHNAYRILDTGCKNYSTYLMHLIMNSPLNATSAYKSIDIATKAFTDPINEVTINESITYNIDDGHTISQITVSGAVGKDDVGIGANGTKAYFTILNYLNREFDSNEPVSSEELEESHYFNLINFNLEYEDESDLDENGNPKVKTWSADIGPISDSRITQNIRSLYEYFLNGLELYLYDRDASQDVGALLSMATDNAKTLALDKINASTDFFAMHIFLSIIGCPTDVIVKYFRSSGFKKVINSVLNDLTKMDLGLPIITEKTFTDLNEFELAKIFNCAKELTALSQILSINQGIKVEEEEIVGQKQKLENAYKDALNRRKIFNKKLGFVNAQGLFNTQETVLNSINTIFVNQGSIDTNIILNRMVRANNAMIKSGINLMDNFDFNRFLNDPDYKEAIKSVFDVVKYNYNIFDIIDKAPHFSKMLLKYNQLMLVYSSGNTLIDVEVNRAPKLYNKDIIFIEKPDLESGVVPINKIKLSDKYDKTMTKYARALTINTMFENFLKEIASESAFSYNTRDKNNFNYRCNFQTDKDIHDFIDFVNRIIIPRLFERYPNNIFLHGLDINRLEAENNGNVFFSFKENLRSLQNFELSGITKLHQIKKDFNLLKDIRLVDLLDKSEETFGIYDINTTVGDFLFLYSSIMKIVNPRVYDFSALLTDFNPTGMKAKYYKFTRDYDTLKKPLHLTSKMLMSYIVRNLIRFDKSGRKVILYTDGSDPLILAEKSENSTYTRYLLGLPDISLMDSSIELADLLTNSILNNKLIITKLNIDCE